MVKEQFVSHLFLIYILLSLPLSLPPSVHIMHMKYEYKKITQQQTIERDPDEI